MGTGIISKWQGRDGVCEICKTLISTHRDWILPDRVVKYCNGDPNHGKTAASEGKHPEGEHK